MWQEMQHNLMSTASVGLYPSYVQQLSGLKNAVGGWFPFGTGNDLGEKMVPIMSECMELGVEPCCCQLILD